MAKPDYTLKSVFEKKIFSFDFSEIGLEELPIFQLSPLKPYPDDRIEYGGFVGFGFWIAEFRTKIDNSAVMIYYAFDMSSFPFWYLKKTKEGKYMLMLPDYPDNRMIGRYKTLEEAEKACILDHLIRLQKYLICYE